VVILTDEDFADLPLSTSHAIEVLEFVPAEQVDPILYNKAYYLEPEATAAKPYVLLRDALTNTDRVAIVKVALRQREQLATLRVRDDVLVLNTMLWPDEVRVAKFDFLDDEVQARPAELAMAGSLIESMAAEFDPSAYTDNYREALQQVIDAKVAGREVVAPEEPEAAPTAAVDLMAALRASVERARAARGETQGETEGEGRTEGEGKTEGAGEAAEPMPIKKTAEKAPAKKGPTKKAPTKKTAAKKPAARKSA
jgi:DNA end-binding protein Ku